jgi:hypothetical protein
MLSVPCDLLKFYRHYTTAAQIAQHARTHKDKGAAHTFLNGGIFRERRASGLANGEKVAAEEVETVFREDGESFQAVIERAFRLHIKSGGYASVGAGEDDG